LRRAVEVVGRFEERVEAAAEAAAGDLLDGEALRAEERRVHQAAALVVADEADLEAAVGQAAGEPGDGGRLAGAQKAADHDISRLVPTVATWTHIVCPASCRSSRRGPIRSLGRPDSPPPGSRGARKAILSRKDPSGQALFPSRAPGWRPRSGRRTART